MARPADTSSDVPQVLERLCAGINAALVLDHAGRAGNSFFLTLFDEHPEILCCPWLHYTYSYLLTDLGDAEMLEAAAVREAWTRKYYFYLLYRDVDDEIAKFLKRIGGDPATPVDRDLVRETFDAGIAGREQISRKELIVLTYLAFARGVGRDLSSVKYLLLSDTISLRTELVMDGFSGKAMEALFADFPQARVIHLIRDPRAGIASTTHQFVNSLGNMYGIHWGNYWHRFSRLVRRHFDWDSVFVFGFWLMYFARTFQTAEWVKARHAGSFFTVKNEDLNLNFVPTITSLCDWLGVAVYESWRDADYAPTMLGVTWKGGASAYKSAYQTNRYGPLQNEPDHIAEKITGPNAYVTQRWKSRLSKNEIHLIEHFLRTEFLAYGYPLLETGGVGAQSKCAIACRVWRPLRGEIPGPRWILNGRFAGLGEIADRLFVTLSFPLFYIAARLVFLRIVREGKIFTGQDERPGNG